MAILSSMVLSLIHIFLRLPRQAACALRRIGLRPAAGVGVAVPGAEEGEAPLPRRLGHAGRHHGQAHLDGAALPVVPARVGERVLPPAHDTAFVGLHAGVGRVLFHHQLQPMALVVALVHVGGHHCAQKPRQRDGLDLQRLQVARQLRGAVQVQHQVVDPQRLGAHVGGLGAHVGWVGAVSYTHLWYFDEASTWFLIMALVIGIIGGLSENRFVKAFINGAADMMSVVLIIALARSITVRMGETGLDMWILENAANALAGMSAIVFAPLSFLSLIPI